MYRGWRKEKGYQSSLKSFFWGKSRGHSPRNYDRKRKTLTNHIADFVSCTVHLRCGCIGRCYREEGSMTWAEVIIHAWTGNEMGHSQIFDISFSTSWWVRNRLIGVLNSRTHDADCFVSNGQQQAKLLQLSKKQILHIYLYQDDFFYKCVSSYLIR